jgi:DNA-binding transcriptional LysR family regulator
MELRHLRYLVAVAEELHLRRAAELGVRLVDRSHRNVALTDAGAALLPEAHQVLRQAEAARLAARSAGDRPGRVLRIGYVPTALLASIPRTLRRVIAATPNLKTTMDIGERHADAGVRFVVLNGESPVLTTAIVFPRHTEHLPTVAPLRAASRTLGQRPPIASERSVVVA